MRQQIASAIAVAVSRAVIIILAGIALCAAFVAAIGFALMALYSALTVSLGPAGAAFATSASALAIPAFIMIATLITTRRWMMADLPAGLDALTADSLSTRPSSAKERVEVLGLEHTLGWITQHPRSATLGAFSFGIAMGAYPDLRKTLLNGVDSALDQQRGAAAH